MPFFGANARGNARAYGPEGRTQIDDVERMFLDKPHGYAVSWGSRNRLKKHGTGKSLAVREVGRARNTPFYLVVLVLFFPAFGAPLSLASRRGYAEPEKDRWAENAPSACVLPLSR